MLLLFEGLRRSIEMGLHQGLQVEREEKVEADHGVRRDDRRGLRAR